MEELVADFTWQRKMASNQREHEAKEQEPAHRYRRPQAWIRIPFRIDDAIMVRSLTNAAHMAQTRIIGAMHGKYILIIEPTEG